MRLGEIQKAIKHSYWLKDIDNLIFLTKEQKFTKSEIHKIVSKIKEFTLQKKIGKTVNWLTLGLIIDQNKVMRTIIHDGVFRIAKFNYNAKFLFEIHNQISLNNSRLHLNRDNQNYFSSKSNFLSTFKEIHDIFSEINEDLKKYKDTIVKDLLIIADFYFLFDIIPQQVKDPSTLNYFTKEEIAESISFLIVQFTKLYKIYPKPYIKSNEKNILANKYTNLIYNSCLIKKYIGWETSIDSFNYSCTRNGAIIDIKSNDSQLEKSIKNGWVSTDIHRMNFHLGVLFDYGKKAASLEEYCVKLFEKVGDKILLRKDDPIERIVLALPDHEQIFSFFKSDQLFLEELSFLGEECREMFVDLDEILTFKIHKNLTFMDVLIAQRFFNFCRIIFSKYLKEQMQKEPEIILRSLVPLYSKEALSGLLNRLIGNEKVENFLELFTWNQDKAKLFDLQYSPVIKLNNSFIVPINIMCKSNLFRNSLFTIRKRLYDGKGIDPIANLLENEFKRKGYEVKKNITFDFQGVVGDIDLISKIGNTVFIFEAKNTILPANKFELRSTYDNLIKAAGQLTKIVEALKKKSFIDYLSKRVGWDLSQNTRICTCIVLGNRVFSGYRLQGHPVRSVFELKHFIEEGTFRHRDGNTYFLWQGVNLEEKDLINYLAKDLFHKVQYEMLNETILSFPLKKLGINYHTYSIEFDHFSDKIKKVFRYKKTSEKDHDSN